MRSVAEVLRLVAESEYYIPDPIGYAFMCISLSEAVEGGLITLEEFYLAEAEIKGFLVDLGWDENGSLGAALGKNSIPMVYSSRKAIYLDWDNRPKPWEE